MFDLTGKVAIVTGGNGGIGLGMARGLAQAGARIVVAGAQRREVGAAVARARRRSARGRWPSPSTSPTRRRSTAWSPPGRDRFGRIDILVNNAGINIRKPPQELALDEWHEVLDTNLTSAFLCSAGRLPAHEARPAAARSSTSAA